MNIDVEREIIEKAESKRDGCFRHKGIAYRVRDGRVTHFADFGTILERCHGFNVVVGEYPKGLRADERGQAILKKIN